MRVRPRADPIGWPTVWVGTAGAVVTATLLFWLADSQGGSSWPYYISDVLFPLVWTVSGLLAWRLRPGSKVGPLMLLLGVFFFMSAPYGWMLPTGLPGRGILYVLGAVGFWFGIAVGGHLVLTYPDGRLAPGERRLFTAAYAFAAVVCLGQLMLVTPAYESCGSRCAVSPIDISENRELFIGWRWMSLAGYAAFAVVVVVLLVRKVRDAEGRRGRQHRTVLAAATVIAALTVVSLVLDALTYPSAPRPWIYYPSAYLVLVLPVAFLLGLLRDRLAYASIADLVRGLDDLRPVQLQASLARTLEDPGLQLLFPVGDGGDYVDLEGRWVEVSVDAGRALTPLGEPAVAVLHHDPALLDYPDLLAAAGSAARLALDNARLQAEVRAQLAEVRASRARIVAAADEERRRLERDLHDGAQQRLLGIGMSLRLLHEQGTDKSMPGLREVEGEVRAAIQELRELAQGIHPAVLTDEGLAAAIGILTRRSPVPVEVDLDLRARPPAETEAAAYYIVSEALQNVAKHAGPCRATVTVRRDGDSLQVLVVDDGRGGAAIGKGSGIAGLRDRAQTVGGSLTVSSPVGAGTRLEARLPCA